MEHGGNKTAQPKQTSRLALRGVIVSVILGIAFAGVALTVWVLVQSPGLRLLACPYCYGFERLQDKVYVESGTPPAIEQSLPATVQASGAKIAKFFRTRKSDPLIFFCFTVGCYRRADGRAGMRGMTFWRAIVISPYRPASVVLTHEWTHEEFLRRLGPRLGLVPIWFTEGLAVYVSDDRRYLAPATSSDRCLIDPTGELPKTEPDWLQVVTHDRSPYARAACRVSRWLARKGNGAVLGLIEEINSGRSFADAYE